MTEDTPETDPPETIPFATPLETPGARALLIHPAEPLPVPAALASLEAIDIVPHGLLVRNRDVAKAFGTKPVTLRTWRLRGDFPAPVHTRGNVSFYRVADLMTPYYQMFPEALSGEERRRDIATQGDVAPPVASRVALSEDYRAELRAIIREGVSEAIERQPEPPSVIEAQAAEMAAQRAEIERLQRETKRLEAELAEALQWREKPLLNRVLKT